MLPVGSGSLFHGHFLTGAKVIDGLFINWNNPYNCKNELKPFIDMGGAIVQQRRPVFVPP